jgi:propanol-preferring alcohol dehydrogenase
MRAIQLVRTGAPLEERTIDLADPGPNDVVVDVRAAGICHSDVHYRRGPRSVDRFPMTLGHEVAGVISRVGSHVDPARLGERVCLHYQTACTACRRCATGYDQFCPHGQMLGKGRDGGYAEQILIPSRNAIHLPDQISFEHGAVMMCSSSTSLHALRKARIRAGDRVAVFGVGGLGMSAVQIARAMGAAEVFAVDLDPAKLALAEGFGAVPVKATNDPVAEIRAVSGGGVDISLELIGLAVTMRQAVEVLGLGGRAVSVGISDEPISLVPFAELAVREAEVMGVADHHIDDILMLLDMAVRGRLDLDEVVTASVPLEARSINRAMDDLEEYRSPVRTVIVP